MSGGGLLAGRCHRLVRGGKKQTDGGGCTLDENKTRGSFGLATGPYEKLDHRLGHRDSRGGGTLGKQESDVLEGSISCECHAGETSS